MRPPTESWMSLAAVLVLFVAGCVQQTPIGDAKMTNDGVIHVWLRAEPPGGGHADGFVVVKPDDAAYREWLDHLGGLTPGETKLVPPWPEE